MLKSIPEEFKLWHALKVRMLKTDTDKKRCFKMCFSILSRRPRGLEGFGLEELCVEWIGSPLGHPALRKD